ncbi:hypothetical protein [Phenylobacterium sp.]|uniref:hypothetical protein n=1 Tax=Phenylobacterium sp. TaxID=1871053 RepID=UPI0035AF8495
MTATSLATRLRASPELFPLDLEIGEAAALIELNPVDYERASFLDARMQRPTVARLPYPELAAAAEGLPVACDYIFHVGHVGSTLMSRVLGTHPAVFSLREPQVLRTLAQAEALGAWTPQLLDARLNVFLALLSRTWTPARRATIKATSLVSELAGRLLDQQPGARALMMTAAPAVYLATILGGPNSRQELALAAPGRLARLNRRLGGPRWRLEALSEGELAAMSWACEMSALGAAAGRNGERCAWIDFDRFLADPRAGLSRALTALHGRADPAQVEAMARSPYFERYSKAPEYGYSPALRREVLAAAERDHGGEIRRGLAWLEAAARTETPLAEILSTAEALSHVA